MKRETKDIYLDDKYQCGGFYELTIQVCPNNNFVPIKQYTNYIWNLDYIYGPLDNNFNEIIINDTKNGSNHGVLILGEYDIPFSTWHKRI